MEPVPFTIAASDVKGLEPLRSLADAPELLGPVLDLDEFWPRFLLQDPCSRLINSDLRLAEWMFAIVDPTTEAVIGRLLTVPLRWDGEGDRFPTRGWDAAIIDSVRCFQAGLVPNTMCLLEMTLRPEARGSGASRGTLRAVKRVAANRGLDTVVAPVRPVGKADHIDLTMSEYIDLRDPADRLQDGWLRIHMEEGGTVVGEAPLSMVISGTFEEWYSWTGIDLAHEGPRAVVPDGLNSVSVQHPERVAVYVESNIWVEHRLTKPPPP